MNAMLSVALGMWALTAAPEWSVDKSSDGITVYTRMNAGWSLKAYKAVMRIKMPAQTVVALIKDYDALSQWYSDCSENKLLSAPNLDETITYFVNDSPFPVMDRDNVIFTKVIHDPATGSVKFDMKAIPKHLPERSDRVRIPRFEGHWLITPISPEETEVVHEVQSDTGGSIPAFMANQQVTAGPMKTLANMRKILQKPKYKNATVEFPDGKVTFGK